MASIPAVHALESAHKARGLRVIAVTKHGKDEAERERIASVASEHHMTAPSFLDFDKSWSRAAELMMNPSFVLLDREGRVAYRSVGQLDEGSAAYREMSALLEKM